MHGTIFIGVASRGKRAWEGTKGGRDWSARAEGEGVARSVCKIDYPVKCFVWPPPPLVGAALVALLASFGDLYFEHNSYDRGIIAKWLAGVDNAA